MSFHDNSSRGDRGGNRFGGGGSKFGGRSGGSKFGGGGFKKFGGRDGDRPQMHRATCSECSSVCEVPFKPTGDRPVYCNQCFKKGDNTGTFTQKRSEGKGYEDRDFGRNSNGIKSSNAAGNSHNAGANYDQQFAILNEKLDKILGAMVEMANMDDDDDLDDEEDDDDGEEDMEEMGEMEEATPKKRRAKS